MFLSVRLAYPERGSFLWGEAIKEASRVGVVELAFVDPHTFLRLQNERIARSLEDVGLRVASIHMAHTRLADFRFFLDVLFKTAALPAGSAASLSWLIRRAYREGPGPPWRKSWARQ